MHRKSSQSISGQSLVADFQTVFVTLATIEAAKYEAECSEQAVMQELHVDSNGTYLNPAAIPVVDQSGVARASLDAHIKKMQAEQLDAMSSQQLKSLIDGNRNAYKGKKVRLTKVGALKESIASVWFNERTGYRESVLTKATLTAVIEDVLLDKNILILKPTLKNRLIFPELQHYIAYIIDPATLEPTIQLDLL